MAESETPRIAVVTFLFSDVEGSTRLLERFPVAQPVALRKHDTIVTQAVLRHDGTVMEVVGDGYYIAFPRATDAVAAAIEIQQELRSTDWGEVAELRVRMSLHSGEAEDRQGKFAGPPLYRCARLLALAYGGQVLISRATAELTRGGLPAGADLRALGTYRLRDLQEPEQVFQLLHRDLPDQFPPIKSGEDRPHNLPAELTTFVGRDRERSELRGLLDTSRLATITGPGGIGKTRLAIAVAADLRDGFEHGTFLVDLTAVAEPLELTAAIGRTMHIREPLDGKWDESVEMSLQSSHTLLVLDNFEQIIGAAPSVARLLAACPGLKIIATSRQSLQVRGEHEFPLSPLAVPDARDSTSADTLTAAPAVALFIQRAQSARPSFELTDQTAPIVAEICRQLDGLPLAIELAAARIKALQPRELLAKLSDARSTFALLASGPQDVSPRHQTLQAAIDWSYRQLEPAEQSVFRQLGVFRGGWTSEAAEAVCDDVQADVSEMLFSLVDKSLVRLTEGTEDETRYTMLSTIWQYAVQQLVASGYEDATRGRHAAYYAGLAASAEDDLIGRDQAGAFHRLRAEQDNLLTGLRWSADHGPGPEGLRIIGALWRFWGGSGHAAECLRLARSLLDMRNGADESAARAKCLNASGNLAFQMGDTEMARAFYEECLELREKDGDVQGAAGTLNNLGLIARERGDVESARTLFEESLAAYRVAKHEVGMALVTSNLGIVATDRGDDGAARGLHEESLSIRRALGDQQGAAISLQNLGEIAMRGRDFRKALVLLRESFAIHDELGDRRGVAYGLESLATLALSSGEADHAVRLFGAAEAARTAIGMALLPSEAEDHQRALESAREVLGSSTYASAFDEGKRLAPDEAEVLPFRLIETTG